MSAPKMLKPWERIRVQIEGGGDTEVDQSAKQETDVNTIVNRYQRTGQLPPGREGIFADVSNFQGELTERLEWSKEAVKSAQMEIEQKRSSGTTNDDDSTNTDTQQNLTTTTNNDDDAQPESSASLS